MTKLKTFNILYGDTGINSHNIMRQSLGLSLFKTFFMDTEVGWVVQNEINTLSGELELKTRRLL